MDNFEAQATQDYTYDDVEVTEMQEQQASYEAPTYEATPVQPAPQPVYAPYNSNPIPATYSEPATEEGGIDGKSFLVGAAVTAVVGGAAIGIKKGIDFFKKKKAEKDEFKKWQEERKAAEDTIAKAKADGKVVDVDAKEVKPEETEEAKQEPAAESKSEEPKDSKDKKQK